LLLHHSYKIPTSVSLLIIASALAVSIVASIIDNHHKKFTDEANRKDH
jgi:hypothetical protein